MFLLRNRYWKVLEIWIRWSNWRILYSVYLNLFLSLWNRMLYWKNRLSLVGENFSKKVESHLSFIGGGIRMYTKFSNLVAISHWILQIFRIFLHSSRRKKIPSFLSSFQQTPFFEASIDTRLWYASLIFQNGIFKGMAEWFKKKWWHISSVRTRSLSLNG